jgi:hypothetical protein
MHATPKNTFKISCPQELEAIRELSRERAAARKSTIFMRK